MARAQKPTKEQLLLIGVQKLPILPPIGSVGGEQTYSPDRWLVENMSPSTVSSAGKAPIKGSFLLDNLEKTWLNNTLGAHFPQREQPKSSVLLTQIVDETD